MNEKYRISQGICIRYENRKLPCNYDRDCHQGKGTLNLGTYKERMCEYHQLKIFTGSNSK